MVINFEIPNIPETYVHRIGRTGRAGLGGKAVSFCDVEEHLYLRDIQRLISFQIPVVEEHPFVSENKYTESNKMASKKAKNKSKQPKIDPGKGKRRVPTIKAEADKPKDKVTVKHSEPRIAMPVKRR